MAAAGGGERYLTPLHGFPERARRRDAQPRGEGTVDLGLLVVAAENVQREAARFERPDVNRVVHDAGDAALIGGRGTGVVAGIDGRTAREKRHGFGRSTVIAESASNGLKPSRSVATKPLPPVMLPKRLWPRSFVMAPLRSGAVGLVFPATMVFRTDKVPLNMSIPPP